MDLFLATVLIALMSLWAMLIGFRQGQRASGGSQLLMQGLVVLASGLYFGFIWEKPILAEYLPHTGLIVLANWHPMMGSFFAGMYLSSSDIGRTRRLIVGPLTLLLAAYAIVAPLVGVTPRCKPTDPNTPLITQSTPYTCSPAAAASLLRLHGIAASEAEMAKLCLTRKGTHWMGVYRGLKIMTQDTEWEVVTQPFSRDAVMNLHDSPAILSVNVNVDGINSTEDHGFHGHSGHSVLALGSRDDIEVMVFDPSPAYGIEYWNLELLSWVSDGVILKLVPRYGTGDDTPIRARISQAALQHNEIAYISWTEHL